MVGLAFAAPATAQNAPTELWSEYPLVPKVEQAAPAPVGPFLPPGGVESPVTDGSSGTGYWLPLLAVVAIALLVAARFARPLAATGTHVVGRRVSALRGRTQLRPRPPRRSSRPDRGTRPSGRSPVQYAPTTMPAAEVETEAPRSLPADEQDPTGTVPFITRRSGLVRSRYVVVADASGRTLDDRRQSGGSEERARSNAGRRGRGTISPTAFVRTAGSSTRRVGTSTTCRFGERSSRRSSRTRRLGLSMQTRPDLRPMSSLARP